MDEGWIKLLVFGFFSVSGWLIGGVIGSSSFEEWSPYCWYGMLVAWAIYFWGLFGGSSSGVESAVDLFDTDD